MNLREVNQLTSTIFHKMVIIFKLAQLTVIFSKYHLFKEILNLKAASCKTAERTCCVFKIRASFPYFESNFDPRKESTYVPTGDKPMHVFRFLRKEVKG